MHLLLRPLLFDTIRHLNNYISSQRRVSRLIIAQSFEHTTNKSFATIARTMLESSRTIHESLFAFSTRAINSETLHYRYDSVHNFVRMNRTKALMEQCRLISRTIKRAIMHA